MGSYVNRMDKRSRIGRPDFQKVENRAIFLLVLVDAILPSGEGAVLTWDYLKSARSAMSPRS